VINKIDVLAANPTKVHNEVFELFSELGASEEQLDFPVVYAVAREGFAKRNMEDTSKDLTPLLDKVNFRKNFQWIVLFLTLKDI